MISLQIAFAVGKPPMAKVLDVFGRCEGVALAAALYTIGGSILMPSSSS